MPVVPRMLAAPAPALAATELDVAEVLRETAASGLAVAAVVAGTVAAAAVLVGVALAAGTAREHRRPTPRSRAAPRPRAGQGRMVTAVLVGVASLAGAATLVELTLLLLDGATVSDRRPLVAVARLLVLAAAMALRRQPLHDPVGAALPVGLGVGALATVVLGAPALGGLTDVAMALVVTLVGLGAAGALLSVLTRAVAPPVAAMSVVVLLAVPASLALVPDRVPPHHEERIVVGDVVLDVTVAPLRPGGNEVHLYAWDGAGAPLAVTSTSVEVRGHAETRHELFVVSPNHHLSYALELPHAETWQLDLTARVADGATVDATLDLEVP